MGTVEKRGNSWRVGVQVYDENGKRRWIRRTFKLNAALSESQQRRQAEKALRQLEVDVENGVARAESHMTLRDLSELWVRRHVAVNCAPVTQADYQHLLDCRILPMLGDTPVEKLTPGMLTDFLAQIKAEGRMVQRKPDEALSRGRTPSDAKKMTTDPTKPLSGRTLVAYYDLLDNLLRHAVQWEILWRNPMDNVERPRFRSKPVKYLDDEQAVALLRELQTVESLSYRCAVLLALLCGLRLGEVDGLFFTDVNWKRCGIDISKALKYTGQTGTILDDTKTPTSTRFISLPPGMMALLVGAHYPEISLTIAMSPPDFVMEAFYRDGKDGATERPGDGESSVTWQGKPLPYLPYAYRHPEYWQKIQEESKAGGDRVASRKLFDESERRHPIREEERIRVEDIRGKLIFIGAEDDVLWDTCRYIRRMEARLERLPHACTHESWLYRHGTHFVFPESMLKMMLPVGSGLLVSYMFRAGKEHKKECRDTRIDIDRRLKQTLTDW